MRVFFFKIGDLKELKNKRCNNKIQISSIMILNIISLMNCSRSPFIHPQTYPILCTRHEMKDPINAIPSDGIYIIDQKDNFILSVINQQTDQESIITLDQKMIKTSQSFIEGRFIYIKKSQYCLLPVNWSAHLQKKIEQKIEQLSSPSWVQFRL